MESKEVDPSKGPEQDQIGVLCLTLAGIFVLLVLRVQLNNYITTLIALAELAVQAKAQMRRKK
jgi:hypothetical protein